MKNIFCISTNIFSFFSKKFFLPGAFTFGEGFAVQMVAKDFSLRFATFEMTSKNKEQGRGKEAAKPPPFPSPLSYMARCLSFRTQ